MTRVLALDDDYALALDALYALELDGSSFPRRVRGSELGRHATRVFLMDRQGTRVVGDLTDSVSFTQYGRVMDNDSELEVSLHFRGDTRGRACCDLYKLIHTWHHDLVVVRGPEIVWGPGPVVTVGPSASKIGHLVARDVVGWLDFRLVHNDYEFKQADVVEVARTLVIDALTKGPAADIPFEERDLKILRGATFTPAGKAVDFEVKADQRTAGDCIRDLAQKGLSFTCVSRSIVFGGDLAFGPYGPLRDGDFIGDLEITEHGLSAATRQVLTGGVGKQGVWGGIDPFYGLVEVGVEGEAATEDNAELTRLARERQQRAFPPPVTVNVPSGGGIKPSAPITMSQLVPGALVDLELRENCRPVHTRQQVTALQAQVGDDQPELVAATFAPPGGSVAP